VPPPKDRPDWGTENAGMEISARGRGRGENAGVVKSAWCHGVKNAGVKNACTVI